MYIFGIVKCIRDLMVKYSRVIYDYAHAFVYLLAFIYDIMHHLDAQLMKLLY